MQKRAGFDELFLLAKILYCTRKARTLRVSLVNDYVDMQFLKSIKIQLFVTFTISFILS